MGDLKSAFAITPEERSAMAAGVDVPARDNGQNYLYAPEGHTLTQDASANRSRVASTSPPKVENASLSGTTGMVHPQDRPGMMGTQAGQAAPRTRAPSPDELLAHANAMLEQQANQHAASLSAGPATGNRDAAGGQIPEWLTREMSKDEHL